jgi:hypothetical protein
MKENESEEEELVDDGGEAGSETDAGFSIA